MGEFYCCIAENPKTLWHLACALAQEEVAEASLGLVSEKSWNSEAHNRAKGPPGQCNYRRGRYTREILEQFIKSSMCDYLDEHEMLIATTMPWSGCAEAI